MLFKTRGIVINYIRYRETSVIVKIYTQEFGIQSYIENGVRSSKSKNKIALFQPLTLLDLVVYHKKNTGLHRLAEIKCFQPFQSIPFNFYKSSIGIFITEILSKTLQEEVSNPPLFQFLFESMLWLDETEGHFENFHLQFLLELSNYLGFRPQTGKEITQQLTEHQYGHFDQDSIRFLDELLNSSFQNPPQINRAFRNHVLEIILKFYHLHIEGLGEIKSISILQEMMR